LGTGTCKAVPVEGFWMETEPPFETVIFTLTDEARNMVLLKELHEAVNRQEIRIVDIRRYRDQLIVTFRRLSS
jgi:hypothetical protein